MKHLVSKIVLFLIAVAYTSQALAFIFGPSDYEECSSSAAKKAKNRDALLVLLQNCETEFPARKNEYGQYVYWDRETNIKFIVSGPKLSDADRRRIQSEKTRIKQEEQERSQRIQQQAQERSQRNAAARQRVQVTDLKNACDDSLCMKKLLTMTVKNNYHAALDSVSVGWVIAKDIKECGAVPQQETRYMVINPGETAVLTFQTWEGPQGSFRSCMNVTAVNVR